MGFIVEEGGRGRGGGAGLGDRPTSEEIPCSSSVINQCPEPEEEEKIADGSFLKLL